MRICYIATTRQNVHTYRWVQYFVEKGHEVSIISPTSDTVAGIQTYQVPIDKGYYVPRPQYIKKIKQIIKVVKPDILHAHQVLGYGMYGALSAFHPFVVSAWGSDIAIAPERSMINKLIVRYVFRKADAIHVNNKYATDILVGLGVPKGKVVEVQWGVDTAVFSPSAKSIDLKNYLSDASAQIITSIRHHKRIYDIETLIKAVPYVVTKIPNVIFVLGGVGKLTKKLREMAERLEIKEYVKFVGLIPHDKMPMYLASSDVFVDTFSTARDSGGIGVGLLEAMSCGTPTIVASRLCISNGLHRWYYGEVFEKGNYVQLAAKIVEMLWDEKKRKVVGEKCRESVMKIGDWQKNMIQIEQLYKSLVYNKKS